jgi:8-oxo-dGTP pyrophosphatase MutT (NUDIX family)
MLLRRGGRHGDRDLELLLVRRSPAARFMPGVWVFPGGTVDAADAGDDEQSHRACAIRELQEEAGIELGGDAELVAWSRWITPEFVPVRFDTRFYVTFAPAHSPPRPDGEEVTEAAWIGPGQALERHAAGELDLVFPTIKHLESLLPYTSAEGVLAAARERVIEPVLPRVVGDGSERRVVLPGDPGY